MKSDGQRGADAAAAKQRAAEIEWLINAAGTEWRPRCDTAYATRVNCRTLPALVRAGCATQIEEILHRPELVPLLKILERHNDRPRARPGRQGPLKSPFVFGNPFLLSPHLFQVFGSVESRSEVRQLLPVLDQPAAKVRSHLQKVAADCKALAALIGKGGPQPHVMLAPETAANETLKVFAPWTALFEGVDGSEREVVAVSELLTRTGDWFGGLADHVPRALRNRHTGNGALRTRAAEFLPGVFRRRLGRPYHAHVATIATIVSRMETDADFVKKVEAQQSRSKQRQVGENLARKMA